MLEWPLKRSVNTSEDQDHQVQAPVVGADLLGVIRALSELSVLVPLIRFTGIT